jgi:ankyrin repeat protein
MLEYLFQFFNSIGFIASLLNMDQIFDFCQKFGIGFTTVDDQDEKNEYSLLHFVCRFAKYFPPQYVKRLIELEKDKINYKNIYGNTALILAAKYANTTSSEVIVNMLIEAGADLYSTNDNGMTALMVAARWAKSSSSENTVKILIEAGSDLNTQKNNGWTALMLAAGRSNSTSSENTVKILIEAGADINIKSEGGTTALMIASARSKTNSSENTVKMLIEAGADLNLENKNGWTALYVATRDSSTTSSENTVRMLINAGADVNLQTKKFQTPLMLASNFSNFSVVKLLLDSGANIEDIVINDLLEKNMYENANFLIQAGASPNKFLSNVDTKKFSFFETVFAKFSLEKVLKDNHGTSVEKLNIAKHYFVMSKKGFHKDIARYMVKFY